MPHMGIFKSSKQIEPRPNAEVEVLTAKISALEVRLDALEKADKGREFEWNSWYDKFNTLNARLAKRIKDAEKLEEESESHPGDNGSPTNTTNPLAARLLQGM